MSRNQLETAYQAKQELARRNLIDYAELVGRVNPAKHHRLLINCLERVEKGEIQRLMIFMPPGHGKSIYSSILFPAWYIGRNPKKSIITASYSSTLSERFGRKVRDQVGGRYYPFTGVTLSDSTKAKGEWETNQGGEYFAAGVGTGITGRRADLGLIDDPIKGREDSDSPVIRDKTWEWYLSDFRTRLKPNAPIIIIMTRWHEDDPAGRILPEDYDFSSGNITARDGEVWFVINLPALAEENDFMGREADEPLWPEWISLEMLNQERRTQGVRNWTALYQQRPSPEQGNYFEREHVQYYTELPKTLRYFGASDFAVSDGENDFTEHGIIGVDPSGNCYFCDWWYGQKTTIIWIEEWLNLVHRWNTIDWATEKGQIEKSIEPFLLKRMEERQVYFKMTKFASSADKPTRAQAFRGRFAQKKIYFPKDKPWADRVIKQLMSFPTGTYDDAVDVCSLFGRMIMQMYGPVIQKEEIIKPRPRDLASFTEMAQPKKDARDVWS